MKHAVWAALGLAAGLLLAGRDRWMPEAQAQAGPAAGNGGSTVLGTGGTGANQLDLCWVLSKVKPVRGPERLVLALYKADRNGDALVLKGVRAIDADLRLIETGNKMQSPTVADVLKALPPEEAAALRPNP